MRNVERFWRLITIATMLVSVLNLGFLPSGSVLAAPASVVSLTTLGTPYTQNFDSLLTSGSATWANDSTLSGWYHARTGTGTTIVANDGTSNGGNLYSYGTGTNTDRALGSIGSGNAAAGSFFWGFEFVNNTGSTITSLDVSYVGEQWRNSAAAAQTVTFSYLIGSPTVSGSLAEFQSTGVTVTSLDFTSPITGGTAGALNGNLAANRVAITYSITGLNIPDGTEVMLRWSDPDQSGSDHGLSIDDFSLTPYGDTPLPNLSINDVSISEGDAGTTTASFTVSLSAPAPAGGVTFDIATADNTATTADSDYVANSLTGQTIAEGNSSYTFDVTINGDVTVETAETFFVNVANVTGANVTDGQGLGTINNDDIPSYALTINDVTLAETNSGTTTASFTVSVSPAAPVGGVTFDITTVDATATVADNDYAANSVVGASIAEGNTTYTFDVAVNGDTNLESNETFDVVISNPTVASITDNTGIGTITNDDYGLSVNDVTVTEGNTGSITASFTVTLSSASASDVTFNIATTDGTATTGDNDYVAKSVTPATITAGNTTYTFDVTVNSDVNVESNETFTVDLTSPTGASLTDAQGIGTITNDDAAATPICQIQGNGASTPLSGTHTIQGVVIGDFEGGASPQIRGFYVQQANCDADPATSDGIFVFNGSNNSVILGDLVRVTGTVGENQSQTQISSVTNITVLSSGNTVTPTDVTLPFASETEKEQYEGMLVRFTQALTVTEHYLLGRFGQVTLSNGKLWQPTGVALPGAPAAAIQAQNDLNKIILDDSNMSQNPDPILFGRGGNPLSASNTLRGGDTVTNLTGVFIYNWGGNSASPNAYRILPVNALGGGVPNFVEVNTRPSTPPAVGGTLKVVGMNLLNYYNTFSGCTNGVGGASASCRGANNTTEFDRQWAKTVAAMVAMGADVYGIVEIENDGYGTNSAIQDLVNKLNDATAPGTFAFVDVDAETSTVNALGTDGIKVGLIYKPAKVNLAGTTAILDTPEFVTGGDSADRNRVSLLQAFEEVTTGETFLVNVNHLKSKGSACDDPDTGDGQGNCSIVRTNAVNELTDWFATDPTGTGDTDIVILGDLNSYAKEDPITALKAAGFTDLGNHFGGVTNYSYVFDGQWGYLDYALASPSLLNQVNDVEEWHINSDEPTVLDYNTEFKTAGQIAGLYAPDQYRISDHDPVIVGLNLNEADPAVSSIKRADTNPTNAESVVFTVAFSENVTDVDTSDFALTTTGTLASVEIEGVSGTGTTYAVTVSTGTGTGTLRLDIANTSDIKDSTGSSLESLPYVGGELYSVRTQTFADVAVSYWAWSWIERLYTARITGGCSSSPLNYCPEDTITRAQMAIFLLRGIHGPDYVPPAATGSIFEDVPASYWAASWIEQLKADGITGGCDEDSFCPDQPVTRAQMAIFLLRAKYSSSYTPPTVGASTGFTDVPLDHWAAAWIKQLAFEGITTGCGAGNYCPEEPVSRSQMAVFLIRTFNIP